MQQYLPPGHSLAGESLPMLGGVMQRVRRDSDGQELVARCASSDYPEDAAIKHLDAEHRSGIDSDCYAILRPAERIDGHRQSWLLYDAVAGEPLDTNRPRSLAEFWDVSEALTETLARAHRAGRAHGRLDSSCIWWDPALHRIGVLGLLPGDQLHLVHHLPATVDTAPELLVDDRARVTATADVYSLGAIFFRLVSGHAPLSSTGNLAFDAAANPPARLDVALVPERLADLVERMLSKSPAARPPHAIAVLAELQDIRQGRPSTPPGLSFKPSCFVGRGQEIDQLMRLLRSSDAGSRVVRIVGEPGVGKSQLLAEVMRRAGTTGLVADGKFEQFHTGRPYAALLGALSHALNRVLVGDEVAFTSMGERLKAADRALLGVLASEVPELEHICGKPEFVNADETAVTFNL